MKKVITLLVFLFASVYCNSQNFLNIPDGLIKSNKTPFPIEFQIINPPSGCVTQDVEVNIGKNLFYLENSEYNNLGGAEIFVDIDEDGNTILKITGIDYSTGGGAQILSVGVQFPENTCNGVEFSSDISAVLYACGIIQQTAEPITIIPQTVNIAKATIAQATFNSPSEEPFCLGKMVKYIVSVRNNGKTGFDINNPELVVELSKCAEIIGVYNHNTFKSVESTPIITLGDSGVFTQTVEWGIPTIVLRDDEYDVFTYDIWVKYPCNDGVNNCLNGENNLSVYLKGETCGNIYSIPDSPLSTKITDINNECSYPCSGVEAIAPTYFPHFPCPTATREDKYITFNLNTSPGNEELPNRVFTVDIPEGLIVTSANNLSSPCDIIPEYYDNTTTSWSPDISSTTRKVRWSIPCSTNVPTIHFNIRFDYTSTSITPDTPLIFTYSLESNSTPVFSETVIPRVDPCNVRIISSKRVKSKSAVSYSVSGSGIPGDIFTYRLIISNDGTGANIGTIIKDELDPRLIYAGGFKYAYTNSANPTLTDLGVGTSFGISEAGGTNSQTVTVVKPPVGSLDQHLIELSGFDFPYTENSLYIEFDVKMNTNVVLDALIPNSIIINSTDPPTIPNTVIKVLKRQKVTSEMLVRCPSGEWIKNSVDVKHDDVIDFKMRFINEGTVPVVLSKLINLKPQSGDLYEIGSAPRESAFNINYYCETSPSISSSPAVVIPEVSFAYANNSVTMDRDMLCPPTNTGETPVWTPTCDGSNWFKVEFSNGVTLPPGEYIEVMYKGKVDESLGTVENPLKAINSFAYALKDCALYSDDAQVTINNIGLPCSATPIPCMECTSFDLLKGQKYLVSGWVKEIDPATPEAQLKNFSNGVISVSFQDVDGDIIGAPNVFHTSGEIIDGWQRIIGEFVVPIEVDDMFLELQNTGTKMTYFDDIRVLPTKGNMKSFVYDQKTQRLMSELDENNYGTFYEYDLEGGLVRIKKETEKGVFTIQETRSGNTKSAQ